MDSITQATLGAAIGHAILGKKIGGKAAIIGAVVATIPDLDVALLPFYDSIQGISIHRGYSHSIVFSILGSLLLTFILGRLKWFKSITFRRLFVFNWLVLVTHMLLDAFTAYGTQLFLPFSDLRVSFDSINIIDPVYTLPLLFGLGFTIYQQYINNDQSIANHVGLVVSTLYLLFTLGHKQHITSGIKAELQEQNISYHSLKTIPVGIGNGNWYGVAKNDETLYIGKYSDYTHGHTVFHAFPINDYLFNGIEADIRKKLKWVSQDYYTVAEKDGKIRVYNLQCDMQGVRMYGGYKAPTAFYYELTPNADGSHKLSTGMHTKTIEDK